MTVNIIKDLFEHGQYQPILDRLVQTDIQAHIAALSEPDQAEIRYYQSRALTELGNSKQGLHVATTAHTTLQVTDKKSPLLLASLSAQIRALELLGEIDDTRKLLTKGDALLQVLTLENQPTDSVWILVFELTKGVALEERNNALAYSSFSQALAGFEKHDAPSHLAETVLRIGITFYRKGEHDTALEYYQRSLAIYEKLEHNAGISSVFLNIGFIYHHKGEWDTMAEYYHQSLTFAEASGVPSLIADALRYVGYAHTNKFKLDTAIRYLQRALVITESIGDKKGSWDSNNLIGWAYYMKGEFDQALDYFQRSLTFATIFQGNNALARSFYSLILVALSRQDLVQAKTYLNDLQNIAAQAPENKHIQFRSHLMEALVSKQSPRMVDKAHALTLLKQLVAEENFKWRWDLTMHGLLNLCDLLIYEARASGEGAAWEEGKALLQQFYTRAHDKKLVQYMAEALLLQAKFALIDGNLQQAQTYLTETKTIVTELDKTLLGTRVEAAEAQLTTDFEKWTNLIRRNATLQERIVEARLEEYLQKAQDVLGRLS